MCAIRHYDVILAHKNENVLLIKGLVDQNICTVLFKIQFMYKL